MILFYLPLLLMHTWHITLCYFQVYSIIIQYLCTFKMITTSLATSINIHSYNCFLTMRIFKIYFPENSQICNKILLTVAMVLYIIPMTYFFYNWKFAPLDPLHLFCLLSKSFSSGNNQFILSVNKIFQEKLKKSFIHGWFANQRT